jgi:hypothetical protein
MNKKILAGLGTLALIGGLAACGSAAAPAAAPTVRVTQTVASTPTVTKTVVPTPTPTVTKTKTVVTPVYVAPAPAAPALTNCGGDVYAGADTSCPFALNVAADYTGLGPDYAYSPVTGLDYTMNCVAGVETVVCTGGDNAYVQWPAS